MVPKDFDTLVRSASTFGTRRGLLHLLTSLSLAGIFAGLQENESEAGGRRKRRKKRHKHGGGDDKQNRKGKRKSQHKGKGSSAVPPSPSGCQPCAAGQECEIS